MGVEKYICEKTHFLLTPNKEAYGGVYTQVVRIFPQLRGYERLKYFVKNIRRSFIENGYDFIEKPGERKALDVMIELAKQGGRDMLYVELIKEFAGNSLTDLKDALTAIEDAGMLIESQMEPAHNYINFMTLIGTLEDLMPEHQKKDKGREHEHKSE